MNFIAPSRGRIGFMDAATGEPFVPVGVNYAPALNYVRYQGKPTRFVSLFGSDPDTEADPIAEADKWFTRLNADGLNVARLWVEPHEFIPQGTRLDPRAVDRFHRLLDIAARTGVRPSVGVHIAPVCSGWNFQSTEPPFDEHLIQFLELMGLTFGKRPEIFSWTVIGEGQMPWYTAQLHAGWPVWLRYQYNDSLDALNRAWGPLCGGRVISWDDAPVPPRGIGACLGVAAVLAGKLDQLPHDPWAGSTWRYDWRLYLEHTGAQRVHREARTLRAAGAKQMITVGANSWTFPNLPAGIMSMGFCPYFYLDSVDYLCQHNYPMPQCQAGGTGDPLSSDEALAVWLASNQIMGRIYASLGKPVVLEEWGWYGEGGSKFADAVMPYRTQEEQAKYCNAMMETSRHVFAGWMHWMHRDMPRDADLTACAGLYRADGSAKLWAGDYAKWAQRLQRELPTVAPAVRRVELPMVDLFTDDRKHEMWWMAEIQAHREQGPAEYVHALPRKPLVDWPTDIRGFEPVNQVKDVWTAQTTA